MTARLLPFFLLPLLLASCAGSNGTIPPEIIQSRPIAVHKDRDTGIFPAGRWQFVHAITFHPATGGEGNVLGVLVLDKKSIRCALMTLEGLSLFEAHATANGPVEVTRALPPFDKQSFAVGLMDDIRTLFRKPPGKSKCGHLQNGSPICRYVAAQKITDILPQPDGCWNMSTYEGKNVRSIHTESCKKIQATVIPKDIHLVFAGITGYSLTLHLISAETPQSAR